MKTNFGFRFTHKVLRFRFGVLICLAAFTHSSLAQQSPPSNQTASPVITAPELENLLTLGGTRILEYGDAFRNLLAEETQTTEVYNNSGQLTRSRRIVSDLIIYQSQLDPKRVAEYRNVREVDNRLIAERDKRVLNLFERLAKAENVEEELKRIKREGSRYNLNYRFVGLTMNQGFALTENLRPAFRLEAIGNEAVNGHETIIVRFQQIVSNPDIKSKVSLHKSLEPSNPLYRGRL
ncbi:MAG: hypothetical protein H0V88_08360 [Pyrinomonadaceae bacterium]|nr:hypothetical protein [Pyrinomonadaceae bacterium]